jgi:hypothetical protein
MLCCLSWCVCVVQSFVHTKTLPELYELVNRYAAHTYTHTNRNNSTYFKYMVGLVCSLIPFVIDSLCVF